jgi:L-rhamnose isomerase
MENNVLKAYELAKEAYAAFGIDTDEILQKLDQFTISIHCWQGDDVTGFENSGQELSGGIQATGNYFGKARNPFELRSDIEKVLSLVAGPHKVNVHACYLESNKKVDRDEIEPEHFSNWADWACANKIGLDFNPTCFSHPLAESGYTLSSADKKTREFWITHVAKSRKVAEYLGKRTGVVCINNIWVPDGTKDAPADRLAPRERLMESLDKARAEKIDSRFAKDAVESKLFGIGSESYVVGSHEFYMGYAMNNDVIITLDTGHFHPTEVVSNKLSALSLYVKEMLLHISRPVRWDSDHVVTMDDELLAIMQEIVRGNLKDRIYMGLDYFDASINRIMAWVIGTRNARKALLRALLEPTSFLKELENSGDKGSLLALSEEFKSMPWQAVYDMYCEQKNVPVGTKWIDTVKQYEKDVLSKR